ncbi:hypothetical protein A2U01_0012269, partial [Trifolium medium]|nr:hypothetical protein [Trifolium medium]
GVVMMLTLLGAEPHYAERQVKEIKGAHTKRPTSSRTSPSGCIFAHAGRMNYFRRHAQKYCPPHYLKYFMDLEMVADYLWGAAALTHLYKGLSDNTAPSGKVIIGYMTLLQLWTDDGDVPARVGPSVVRSCADHSLPFISVCSFAYQSATDFLAVRPIHGPDVDSRAESLYFQEIHRGRVNKRPLWRRKLRRRARLPQTCLLLTIISDRLRLHWLIFWHASTDVVYDVATAR